MSRIKGKRYDGNPKLNKKKVLATIIALIVIIMMIISLKKILFSDSNTSNISTLETYFTYFSNEKWGVIDNKGDVIIKPNYDEMIVIPNKNVDLFVCVYDIDFNNNTYKTRILNSKGEEILSEFPLVRPIENSKDNNIWFEDNILTYEENGKLGIIDFSGKKVTEAEYDNIYAMPGIEKSIVIEKDGKKGLLSSNSGEIIIEPTYTEITSLTDTYENGYIVKNDNNLYGVVAADKTKVLDTKYIEVKKIYSNEMYVVNENGKIEIVDKTGKVILNSGYDNIVDIQSDKVIIIKDGKYGVLDTKGDTIIEPKYENIKFSNTKNYISQLNGKYGIIDEDDNKLVNFIYSDINYINSANFYEAEKADYKTDIIDRNFKIALENVIVSELNLNEGYLRVRKDSDYKYYNFKLEEKNNQDVLLTNSLFLVKENGKYGYVNKQGEKIVDCIYDDAKEQNSYGYCAVKKDGKWGSLNANGVVVIEPTINLDDYLYIDFIDCYHRVNDLSINAYTR